MASGFRCLAALLAALAVASPARAQGEEPAARDAASNAGTQRARRHFKNGVKLYKDTNYTGALAEFEAAYREKPGPGSLQNVALCLKALFRYAEAAEALRGLLERHAAELSAGEQEAVRSAIAELESLVGFLLVGVEPANASLSVNGRPLTAEERERGLRLNVGEHTLIAEAPGYARRVEVVRVASQQRVPVKLALAPIAGFLEIVTSDPKAAIAVDDEPLAYGGWTGPVAPGEHVVQIYRDGFEPFERNVRVELGKTLKVQGRLGPATGDAVNERAPLAGRPAAPPPRRTQRGFYALGTLSVMGLTEAPLGFQVSGTDANLALPSFGARGGYRLSEPIAVEALLDVGQLEAKGVCQPRASAAETSETPCEAYRDFSLASLRFGPNLRLLTRGESLRFTIAIGAGVVGHWLEIEAAEEENLSGGKVSGADPYFNLELGVSYNYRHLLAQLDVIAYIDGASELRGDIDERDSAAVFEDGTLPMLGLGLKLGYSAWTPR